MECEIISANYTTHKQFISKIYEEFEQFNSKNTSDLIKKGAKTKMNRHYSKKKKTEIANTCIKKCSLSLIIKEMQIKSTIRYITSVK